MTSLLSRMTGGAKNKIAWILGGIVVLGLAALPFVLEGIAIHDYAHRHDATTTRSGTVVKHVMHGRKHDTTSYDLRTASGDQTEIDMPAHSGSGDVRDLSRRVGQHAVATTRDGEVVSLRFADGRVLRTAVGTAHSVIAYAAGCLISAGLVCFALGLLLDGKPRSRRGTVAMTIGGGVALGALAFSVAYGWGMSWQGSLVCAPIAVVLVAIVWRTWRSDRWAARRRQGRAQMHGSHVKVD